MSLDICRQENTRHPEHLRTNINATCYAYVSHVIDLLRAAGKQAYFVCKTAGEGQYTPAGFVPFTGPGLDGKPYTYTGVSHDALWCDGKQFDTAARANDSPDPIFNPDGSPMTAEPVWNEIPQQYWRVQNPPLKDSTPVPQPQPCQLPGREEMMNAGKWLHHYYRAPEGLQRPDGLWKPETPSAIAQPDWEGIGAWLFDVYLHERVAGRNATDATLEVIRQIRQTDEWKSKHPGQTP